MMGEAGRGLPTLLLLRSLRECVSAPRFSERGSDRVFRFPASAGSDPPPAPSHEWEGVHGQRCVLSIPPHSILRALRASVVNHFSAPPAATLTAARRTRRRCRGGRRAARARPRPPSETRWAG